MSKRILIIDDEHSIRESLEGILEDEGFEPLSAPSAERGLELLATSNIDLVLLDIWLGENMDGLTALEKIREFHNIPVIMISGHGNVETAVQATKKGAFDFIEKPLSYDKIILAITNGLRFAKLEEENRLLRQGSGPKSILTGESESILAVKKQIEMVAPTDAWVLIRGDHGTGKELVAQSIHRASQSSHQPMIEVNCAAIPEELIESELFGHEKGSFTGAHSSKRGKFDQADGGILFLDEIGDMSLTTQAKILRILQEQKFERVGGNKTITVNVRVLAATNKNLEEEIEAGNFRADLFWRLNVVPINVPPLKDRLEDIPLLVEALMKNLVQRGLPNKTFGEDAYQVLMQHDWPGNVRELRNFIERIAIMCQEENILASHINLFLSPHGATTSAMSEKQLNPFLASDYKTAKKLFEKEYLKQKLLENDNNISKTAEQVGLERSHLHKKLKSYEIIQ
ncbi:sigma-54-dependent transcriptional regulator [Desulforhopalus singaporensis]|uniref:Two-component system, NtrC family, nitrogen regulation response regulator NtrX n=1 Tax=Desulforhopalus singaporensis TaxID=91360 RepID=A0A1H0MGH9_9BACT|nr:sigma-54 dependent transcriptional regulator [Desulforhopalus singaporensis]SDO79533.1 two-component system, NtrC family, nitrogen regulation response regulator NtrX [Desulforhopalus singaporensis]